MQVEGIVTRLDGTHAFVKVLRVGGCGRCNEAGGCQSGSLADPLAKRCQEYSVDNPEGAQPGARVAVEVPDGSALKAAFLGYGIPVFALIAGAGLGQQIQGADLGALVGGAMGLGIAVSAVVAMKQSRFVQSARPRIVQILH